MSTGELPAIESRVRLFVAVEVPPSAQEAVDAAAAPLQRYAAGAKWVAPSAWHLTLAFIGWVSVDEFTKVEAACAAAAEAVEPFECALDGTAAMFGRRVLWAGLAPCEELAALAHRVRSELKEAGFPAEDRPFRAHLTLARAARSEPLPRDLAERYRGPTDSWPVDRIVLMRSRLRRTGARYTIEAAWRL